MLVLALVALAPLPAMAASAANQGVVAVVSDQPITNFDVEQRIKLTSILGSGKQLSRKQALELLINDVLKRNEIKKFNVTATEDANRCRGRKIGEGIQYRRERPDSQA